MDYISKDSIIAEAKDKVFVQDYSKKTLIDGVKIVEIKNMVGEDGDLSELLRLSENGEAEGFPGFHVRQINRSKMLPNIVKAWHLHYKQEEIQTVRPEDHLIFGLWDVREGSPTKNVTMKFAVGGGKAALLYIPKGVAHGYMNVLHKSVTVVYFVSEQFDINSPDENRLPWDSLPGFWEPTHE